jgi:hypothetical protein
MKRSILLLIFFTCVVLAAVICVLVALFCVRRDVRFEVGAISVNRTGDFSLSSFQASFSVPVKVINENFFDLQLEGTIVGKLGDCPQEVLVQAAIPRIHVRGRGEKVSVVNGSFRYRPAEDKGLCVAGVVSRTCTDKSGVLTLAVDADVTHETWVGKGSSRLSRNAGFPCSSFDEAL